MAARNQWKQATRDGLSRLVHDAKHRSIQARLNHNSRASLGAKDNQGGENGGYWLSSTSPTSMAAAAAVRSAVKDRLLAISKEEQDSFMARRCPKAIVFSQHDSDIQGVGHELILTMGDSSICEHFGTFRSNELSRFRHSKRKYRRCPLCGFSNQITANNCCANRILMVRYLDVPPLPPDAEEEEEGEGVAEGGGGFAPAPPQPGGHGSLGPGGHYTGRCLCCPRGCEVERHAAATATALANGTAPPPPLPANPAHNTPPYHRCGGYPNPFFNPDFLQAPDLAMVAYEHVIGYVPGMTYAVGQQVFVRALEPEACDVLLRADTTGTAAANDSAAPVGVKVAPPVLWRGGVLGGRAMVVGWRACGGKSLFNSWHGDRVLNSVPWCVEEEDASVLLLKEDGSTGLDLSFATHIFLLDPIKDPALHNQIVSRAHRMGATGPVQVQLVQVMTDDS